MLYCRFDGILVLLISGNEEDIKSPQPLWGAVLFSEVSERSVGVEKVVTIAASRY